MIRADLAKMLLAQCRDQLAEVSFIQKWSAFIRTQAKMCRNVLICPDLLPQAVAEFTRQCPVKRKGVLINIDFPAAAAGVSAGIGGTAKGFVIIRPYLFHRLTIPFSWK